MAPLPREPSAGDGKDRSLKAALLRVDGLWKRYCRDLRRSLYYGACDIARELLPLNAPSPRLRPQEFWALRDVSLTLEREIFLRCEVMLSFQCYSHNILISLRNYLHYRVPVVDGEALATRDLQLVRIEAHLMKHGGMDVGDEVTVFRGVES